MLTNLPLPPFYDPAAVERIYHFPYEGRAG